jgi:hypothetical protein
VGTVASGNFKKIFKPDKNPDYLIMTLWKYGSKLKKVSGNLKWALKAK